jgi:hypothetical protein
MVPLISRSPTLSLVNLVRWWGPVYSCSGKHCKKHLWLIVPLATMIADVLYRFSANVSCCVIVGQLGGYFWKDGWHAGVLEREMAGLLENVRTAQRNAPAQWSTVSESALRWFLDWPWSSTELATAITGPPNLLDFYKWKCMKDVFMNASWTHVRRRPW